jgi:hypothetical protein
MFMTPATDRQGLAFSLPTSVGYMVGLETLDIPRIGTLVWIAGPTFAHPPTLDDVRSIREWRWPTLFPVRAAIRRKIVDRIGPISVPEPLLEPPTMRGGGGPMGWVAFKGFGEGQQLLGQTRDRSLPIYEILNDSALREKIETGWMPSDEF